MVSSQKKAQYDMSKTTFGTQGQNAKTVERVTGDNSSFWWKSYNIFTQIFPEFNFYVRNSLVLPTELDSLMNTKDLFQE